LPKFFKFYQKISLLSINLFFYLSKNYFAFYKSHDKTPLEIEK